MDRLKMAAEIINKRYGNHPQWSILDVGSRDNRLKSMLKVGCKYYSNDLFQNEVNGVDFVGDIMSIDIAEQFDLVCAIDILEHTEMPNLVFERLVSLSTYGILISLPNCYDLKSRLKFMFSGSLGGKYRFLPEPNLDRHRWLMSRSEIWNFYCAMASANKISKFEIIDMQYGDRSGSLRSRIRSLTRSLPNSLCTSTVFGWFEK
jgi:hypothetical protein